MTSPGRAFLLRFGYTLLLIAGSVMFVSIAGYGQSLDAKFLRDQCTFSNGGTIAFGGEGPVGAGWRTGEYEATTFRVSKRMVIPPMDQPLVIPPGHYTLFVKAEGKPPWTMIISRKTGPWGMSYPGEQYDLGRTFMGSDVRPPVQEFVIGCTQVGEAPIFVWMQSGRFVALLKILAEKRTHGKIEYLVH
jgi:hypothetical protein